MEDVGMTGEERVDSAATVLEEMTNVYGCRKSLGDLAFRMTRMHRTLVQSFTGGFIIPFVREMAKLYRAERFDDRDRAACEACLAMTEAIEKKYDVKEDDGMEFPLI